MGLNIIIECNLTDLLKSNVGDLYCLHNEDEGILSRVALHLQWCSEKTEEPEKALFVLSEADYQVSYQIVLRKYLFHNWPLVVSFIISTAVGTKKEFLKYGKRKVL